MSSTSRPLSPRLLRYAAWIERWRYLVLALAFVVVGIVGATARLPLKSDLSSLLPPSQPSVRDLEVLKHRARAFGNVMVMIEAPTAALRIRASAVLEARLRELDPTLVSSVSGEDGAIARFGWANRFAFAPLADLTLARDALKQRLLDARLKANPLFIDLDDDDEPADAAKSDELATLMKKLDDAEAAATAPSARISRDGLAQLYTIQVTFPGSNIPRGKRVMAEVHAIGRAIEAAYPGAVVSYAGNVNINIFEHDSVVEGMAGSAILTLLLCAIGIFFYYRSVWAVGALLWALVVGVAGTVAFTASTIGHLNIMSAFLAAIVVGNGLNSGLVFLARYFEEVRARPGHTAADQRAAIAPALAGAIPGTLAAALTATIAYGSLIVTDFRGFRHFGVIGGVGMLLCWLTAMTVLPAGIAFLAHHGWIPRTKPPGIGKLLARLAPRRFGIMLWTSGVITAVGLVIAIVYIARDPFAKDWRALESDSSEILAQRVVDRRMKAKVDGSHLGGHSFQLVVAVDDRAQVAGVVAKIRAVDASRPPEAKLFVEVRSIDDVVPPDQRAKHAVLGEIRTLLEDPAIAQLAPDERAKLERLRPPVAIPFVREADVPMEIGWPFIEQDGTVGRLVFLKGSRRFQTWNVDDRIQFAKEVRAIHLPPGTVIGGEPLVIADIVASMKHDAPLMLGFSLLGSVLAVCLVVGIRRHGIVTVVCGLAGVVLMIAGCAVAGLPVHFLDLIALPISIGIGIDYAVNLAARDREDPTLGPRRLLETTGGAVLLCSYTTAVGYGSLFLSANRGIRAFGTAAVIGEITCIAIALLLAPTLLAWWRARQPGRA